MRTAKKLFFLCLIGLGCVSQLLPQTAKAQDNTAINTPLPARFFSENTLLLARVDVEKANIERVFETIAEIVPNDLVGRFQAQQQQSFSGGPTPSSAMAGLATMRQLADNPSIIAQLQRQRPNEPLSMIDTAAKQLLAADIQSLYLVLMQEEPSPAAPAMYFLSPRESSTGGANTKARKAAFSKAANLLRADVVTDGKWLVASTSELPRAGDDFGLDEEAFLEALRSNPLHDFMIAFVPTEEMRTAAREGWDQMLENSPPEEKQIVPLAKSLIQVLDGDWFYLSLQLGETPAIRVSAHFANSQKPKTLSRSLNQLIAAMPNAVKVKPSDNPTVQKVRQENTKVQMQLLQFLSFQPEGPFLTCDFDEESLVAFVNKLLELQDEPVDNSPSAIDPTGNYGK